MSEKQGGDYEEKGQVGSLSVVTYDQLITKIASDGPYILTAADADYSVAFNHNFPSDRLEADGTAEGAVSITLTNKFTTLSTLVTKETVEGAGSIDALADTFLVHPQRIYGASAELQYIETEIKTHLGIDPVLAMKQVIAIGFPDEGFAENLSEECEDDLWRTRQLRTVFDCLIDCRGLQYNIGAFGRGQAVSDAFPSLNDLAELMDHHFNQGFLLARLISEYFARFEIGPLAEKGLAAENAQERRTAASGQRSKEMRHQRIEMLLTKMKVLLSKAPVVATFGLKEIAKVAFKESIREDPKLWRQGRHQLDEYLSEMASDVRYQARYVEIKRKTA